MTDIIFAITENRSGAFKKVSFEVISAARKLADRMKATVTAVAMGHDIKDAGPLQKYGADEIITVDDAAFESCDSDVYTQAVNLLVNQFSPNLVLCGGTAFGKELMSRLSAGLEAGMVSDCIDIELENDTLVYTRPVFGGKLNAKMVLAGDMQMATLRPNVFDIVQAQSDSPVKPVEMSLQAGRSELVEQQISSSESIDLTEADVVVAGGRGTNGDFKPIEDLAAVLNGAVAASRTVIDEGWRPHSDQVGQTGVVVSPNLYIACGISGAVQHFAGMSGSKTIVAVNKDAEAPIFSKSDYGIVGDLFDVVPALIDEIKAIQE